MKNSNNKTMSIFNEHWKVSEEQALKLQKELIEKIEIKPLEKPIRYIAGTDIAYNKANDNIYSGIVVLDFNTLEVVTRSTVIDQVHFPYVPGLLSFREIPSLFKAWEQLTIKPDLIVTDGHGIAHPKKMDVACHFGIITKTPTIGVGKKILIGHYKDLKESKGSFAPLIKDSETIGYAFRAGNCLKPVFVSPGHFCNFKDALNIISKCAIGFRIPEPTRQADIMVNALRRGELEVGLL